MAPLITLQVVIILGAIPILRTASSGANTSKTFLLSLCENRTVFREKVKNFVAQRHSQIRIKWKRQFYGIITIFEI